MSCFEKENKILDKQQLEWANEWDRCAIKWMWLSETASIFSVAVKEWYLNVTIENSFFYFLQTMLRYKHHIVTVFYNRISKYTQSWVRYCRKGRFTLASDQYKQHWNEIERLSGIVRVLTDKIGKSLEQVCAETISRRSVFQRE